MEISCDREYGFAPEAIGLVAIIFRKQIFYEEMAAKETYMYITIKFRSVHFKSGRLGKKKDAFFCLK